MSTLTGDTYQNNDTIDGDGTEERKYSEYSHLD